MLLRHLALTEAAILSEGSAPLRAQIAEAAESDLRITSDYSFLACTEVHQQPCILRVHAALSLPGVSGILRVEECQGAFPVSAAGLWEWQGFIF